MLLIWTRLAVGTTFVVLKRVVEDAPRSIQEVIPEMPHWLCAIIARLQAKKPKDRFATAREVADLLGRCLAEMQRPGIVPNLPDLPPQAAKVSTFQEIPVILSAKDLFAL